MALDTLRNFWKTALLLAWALGLSYPLMAQNEEVEDDNTAQPVEDEGPKHISGGYGYFSPGYGLQDLGDANSYLGQETFQNNGFTLGGGGQLMVRSIVLGGEGSSFLARKGSIGTTDARLESGCGKFYLGYVVYGRKGLLIYPKVGIGSSKQVLSLHNTTATTTVDTILTGAYTSTTMQKNGLFASFGAGLDWMPGFDETAGSGIVFGVDLGYNMALSEKPWESFGTSLTGGPSITNNGFYAALHIGFAGWNRQ